MRNKNVYIVFCQLNENNVISANWYLGCFLDKAKANEYRKFLIKYKPQKQIKKIIKKITYDKISNLLNSEAIEELIKTGKYIAYL